MWRTCRWISSRNLDGLPAYRLIQPFLHRRRVGAVQFSKGVSYATESLRWFFCWRARGARHRLWWLPRARARDGDRRCPRGRQHPLGGGDARSGSGILLGRGMRCEQGSRGGSSVHGSGVSRDPRGGDAGSGDDAWLGGDACSGGGSCDACGGGSGCSRCDRSEGGCDGEEEGWQGDQGGRSGELRRRHLLGRREDEVTSSREGASHRARPFAFAFCRGRSARWRA